MRRISFDDSEEQRMSNVLQRAFGMVTSTVAPKEAVAPLPPTTDLSGDPESSGVTEEYEKRVILESVRRAKERSGLVEEGVSAQSPRVETVGALNYAPSKLAVSEFVYLPFGVFRERIGIAEKIIFFYLCSIAKQSVATASLRQIVEGTCIGKTCVCQALSELREAGWIRWDMVRSGRSRLNRYFILRWVNTGSSDSGLCSECEQSSEYDLCAQNGQCSDSGQSSDSGHTSGNGPCSQNGHSSECEQCSDSERSVKSLAETGFDGCGSEYGQRSDGEQCSDSGQSSDSEQRLKNVDTTEFRRNLIEILRTVKTVDLKDLKDNKNKLSDFVDNLCITRVDNSMLAEYVSTMFRIAFPGQSTEKLQVVRKLTERLQVGFAWYVVLLFIIKSSPYLMGKDKNSDGWKCTLTWALAADNYPKIMQLTYVKYGLRWTPQNFIEYLCRALEKGEY